MRNRIGLTLAFAVALVAVERSASAQEQAVDNFSGVGVRAMGMGGAFVGIADDFSAMYWNPAGLAQIKGREVYFGFQRNRYEGDSFLGGVHTTSDLANTHFGSLGVVVPYPVYQGSLVFALGVNRVKDFDSIIHVRGFSEPVGLQLDDQFRHEGGLNTTTLAGAMDVSPEISLGLAVNLWRGEDQRVNDFDETDSEDLGPGISFKSRDFFEDDYSGVNAKLGLLIRSSRERPTTRFGLTVSSGVTHEIDYAFTGAPSRLWEYEAEQVRVEGLILPGDLLTENRFNVIPVEESVISQGTDANGDPFVITDGGRKITHVNVDDAATPETETIVREQLEEVRLTDSYKLSLPIEFGVGFSYRARPDLLLAATVHLAEWAQSEYAGRDDGNLRSNVIFEEEYEDIIRYHLGLEWQVPEITLALRAGFYSDPLPYVGPLDVEDEDPSNTHLVLIKKDRRFVTLGAGLVVDEVIQMDLAWTRGSFERIIEGGVEEGSINRSFASLAYHF
jgi:long-subunit fatty acid transport protein